MEATYQGEVECEGRKCHKVWITSRTKDGSNWDGRTELWLAEDRNYIPVRKFGYAYRESPTIPVSEAKVEKWLEIESGVWFPQRASEVRYDGQIVQKSGRREVSWQHTYDVTNISLDPQYELSFFRDLEFPDGAAIYHVENGKIVKSYVAGGPADPKSKRTSWLWWLIPANVAIVLAVLLTVVMIRRSKRVTTP
jgi:hypothetical protein